MKLKAVLIFILLIFAFSGCSQIKWWIFGQEEGAAMNENTGKKVILSGKDIRPVIDSALKIMIEAYQARDAAGFISYVSDDFTGDDTMLDRAIRRDFSIFSDIDIRVVLYTVTADSNGNIYASLSYNRRLVSMRTGDTFTDRGMTELTFRTGADHPLLYSMRKPIIFGLSKDDLTAGTVIATGDNSRLVVDDRGNITIEPR
jgi:hypothetical protein